jgi:tetratricopeptide (TPR) repeat protein
LGICRQLTGDPDGAIAAWQEAAARDPHKARPCYRAAVAEEQRGNKLNALYWYRQALGRKPADEKLLTQLHSRITALENDPDQLRQQADRCADQGDTAGAVAVYEKIAGINPKDGEAWREAGVGHAMLSQFDKSLECIDKALKADIHDDMAWDFKAVTLTRLEKIPLGLTVLDEGLMYCLNSARLWARRSYLLGRLDRNQEALASACKAIELDPDYGSAYLYRFDAERKLGKTAEALDSINRHIAWIRPRDQRKAIESMRLKWVLENPGQELDPQQAAGLQEHAFHYWQTGDTEQSLATFREATGLDPFSYEIWNNYGSSLSGVGRYEDAITCFERANELQPLITDFLRNKAVALARLNRPEEALVCHGQVLVKSPNNEFSLEARCRLLGAVERWEESLAAAESFAAICPKRPEAHELASWALRKLGRPGQALAAIDRAIELSPDNRELWLNKSIILDDLGLADEADDLQVRAFEDKDFAGKYHQDGLDLLKKMGL